MPPTSTLRNTRGAAIRLLHLMFAASIALPAVLFVFAAYANYRSEARIADERIDHTLEVLQQQAIKVFQSIELAIAVSEATLRDLTDEEIRAREGELHLLLLKSIGRLSQVQSIWVFDRAGRPLVTTVVYPVPQTIDNSERDYFKAQVAEDRTYIGELIVPRIGSNPIFTVSRRRMTADGFNGVVAAAIMPTEWAAFYGKLVQGPGAYFALLRDDGKFLARYPAPSTPNAALDPTSVVRGRIAAAPQQGIFNAKSQLDGVERRIGYRRVAEYPVYVMAGVESDAITREWLGSISRYLLFGIPLTAILLGVIALALRRTQRLYAEADRREAAEEALRQTQKIEAIGQLTGGVAHDFNNLLTVVIGNLEFGLARVGRAAEPDRQLHRWLQNAMSGAQRAATLTQRLLAFARRQPLKAEPVDCNALVADMADMLHRLLGENVRIETLLSPELWPVLADKGQLESAILNLAVNARDAMPEGGKLTIATANATFEPRDVAKEPDLRPGDYVMLGVADTGTGMSPEIQAKAFEPFFTTKAVGQGTGLGLSQVYGFIKQSGGVVRLHSEVGRGTTLRIFLPRAAGAGTATQKSDALAPEGRGETILLVEDDAAVRAYVAELLQSLNYRVHQAANAEQALNHLARHGAEIALLLTDVVLPGVNGRALSEQATRQFPHLRVVFMTGYSRDAIVHNGRLDEGVELLPKPLKRDALALRLRTILHPQ